MAKIEIPNHLRSNQGELEGGEFYWIDVKLHDGRVLRRLVSDGKFISGIFDPTNGARNRDFPFTGDDISNVRRHSILPFWW
jgi:hypothetical protein